MKRYRRRLENHCLGISTPRHIYRNETGMAGWKEAFKTFSDFYDEDFPNPLAPDGELEFWQTYWVSNKSSCPNSVASTLKAISFDSFANIKVALRILATLPVTSCECERPFSAMLRLKNYTRSTMVEERLNGLCIDGNSSRSIYNLQFSSS